MSLRETPKLSVVIAMVGDTIGSCARTDSLAEALEAFCKQVDAPPMELIVAHHEQVDGIDALKQKYPDVIFVPASDVSIAGRKGGGREHHDVLRARGMAVATGDVVGLVEDHALPDDRWCATAVETAHQEFAAIGGAMENCVDRVLNWAVYFCDFGRYQNPVPAGESSYASDANVAYKRSSLLKIRETWEHSYREVVVNGTLQSSGEKLALSPKLIMYQNRRHLRLGTALRERYVWGRSYSASRNTFMTFPKRLIYAVLSPVLPFLLTLRMFVSARRKQRCFGKFVIALPIIFLLQVSWSLGEGIGYLVGVRQDAFEASESAVESTA